MLRSPLLHFLVLGGLAFGVARYFDTPPRPRVVLTANDVAALRAGWTRAHGTPPGPAAERTLVETAVDEAILLEAARALGVDRRDGAVRERLVRLGRFVGEDAGSEAAIEEEARRLQLDRSDLVIRRHLGQMMRLAVARVGPQDMPTEAEQADWLARHPDVFAQLARLRVTQVYVSRARHGAAVDAVATRLLETLRRDDANPDEAPSRGDPFIHGADSGLVSRAELERRFGAVLARSTDDAPVGEWIGPVASPWGVHLVWVHERVARQVPPLASVRGRVLHAMLAERGSALRDERLRALRARYDVVVEAP